MVAKRCGISRYSTPGFGFPGWLPLASLDSAKNTEQRAELNGTWASSRSLTEVNSLSPRGTFGKAIEGFRFGLF